jgi:hypothetical protein
LRVANRGATEWNDLGNDGNWGWKMQSSFEIYVPQSTKLGFDNDLESQVRFTSSKI